ncbi:MAG: hypothetical protein P4L51_01155 [Puia sp.]|nr:hypothetical protein [Puia sp.]
MLKQLLLIAVPLLTAIPSLFCQQDAREHCGLLKTHKLRYLSIADSSAYIILNGDSAIEYHHYDKYRLTARLEWAGECEYNLILSSVDIPGFVYHPGDVMHVRIDRIEGDLIYYYSTINGNGWEGKLRILPN